MTVTLERQAAAEEAPGTSSARIRMSVAVLVVRFPRIDQPYILDEITELERLGQPVVLVPLRREHASVVHEGARTWLGRALYTSILDPKTIVANLRMLATRPIRYLRLFAELIAGTFFEPKVMIQTLAVFPKAVRLAHVLRARGVRHVHAHFSGLAATAAHVIGSLSPITYSFTVHGPDIFVDRHLLRQKIAGATFVRCISTFNAAFLEGLYGSAAAERVNVVHMGVRTDVFQKSQEEAAPTHVAGRVRLLTAASLSACKGFPVVVDACARLVAAGVDVTYDIVGDGPRRAEIEEAIARTGMGQRVRLLGALPAEEVARLMGACDAYIMPSVIAPTGQMDGIPVSLMEAMAAARPVIGAAISGLSELVEDGRTGLLVDMTNPGRVAAAVERLAHDPELRNRLGTAAREQVRVKFDVRPTAAALLLLLDRQRDGRDSLRARTRLTQLDWDRIDVCAIGIRTIYERRDSIVAELTVTNGIRNFDAVVKQATDRADASRDAVSRTAHERRTLERLRQLMSKAPATSDGFACTVPAVLMYDDRHSAIVMERAPGKRLDLLIRTQRALGNPGRRLIEPLRRAGRWLRTMQEQTADSEDGRYLLTALTILALQDVELAAAADPAIRKSQQKIVETIRTLETKLATRGLSVVGHHCDFWPGNIFVAPRRVTVIDLEGFREGLPLEDVAYLLVHLELCFSYPFTRRTFPKLREAFLKGYTGGDSVDPDELRFFTLVKALHIFSHGNITAPDRLRGRLWRRALRGIIRGQLG